MHAVTGTSSSMPAMGGTAQGRFNLQRRPMLWLLINFFHKRFILICALSKITAFLVVRMTQQAVMQISLKIGLPKFDLASITMSRGGRLRFQEMVRVFQHA